MTRNWRWRATSFPPYGLLIKKVPGLRVNVGGSQERSHRNSALQIFGSDIGACNSASERLRVTHRLWPDDRAVAFRRDRARVQNPSKFRIVCSPCAECAWWHLAKQASTEKEHAMELGTVKFFNEQKGFGFIAPDNGGTDVFVHVTALERAGLRSLSQGQKVSFDTEQDRRTGKTAVANIRAE